MFSGKQTDIVHTGSRRQHPSQNLDSSGGWLNCIGSLHETQSQSNSDSCSSRQKELEFLARGPMSEQPKKPSYYPSLLTCNRTGWDLVSKQVPAFVRCLRCAGHQGYRVVSYGRVSLPVWWGGHSKSIVLVTGRHHCGAPSECIRKYCQKVRGNLERGSAT